MHSLGTWLKSLYGKLCILLVLSIGLIFFAYQAIAVVVLIPANLLGISPKVSQLVELSLLFLAVLALWKFVWKKLAYLDDHDVIHSNKITIGIFILTLALVAFPGTLVAPIAYAAWSGRSDMALFAYYSMLGFPVFLVLSPIGIYLVKSGRPRSNDG